jgi:hypothetical protein
LGKDPDSYQKSTPQYKIGKLLNKESGSLIKFYKTGLLEDGYKGYSTDYQDLNIDIYKIELWNIVKEVVRLLDCDVQKLENRIFPQGIEECSDIIANDPIYNTTAYKKNVIRNRKANYIQRNESLDKHRSLSQTFVVLRYHL